MSEATVSDPDQAASPRTGSTRTTSVASQPAHSRRTSGSTDGWTRLERVRVRPTRRSALHLTLGVVLYAGGANVAAGWVMALAGIVLGVIPWALFHALRAAGRVDVRRHVPQRATAGVPVAVALDVRVPTPATVLVDDALTRAAQAVRDPSAGRRLEAAVSLERGVHEVGEVAVDVSDPFGLVSARAVGDVPGPITVLPPVPRVDTPDPATGRSDGDGATATRTGGVEVLGIREHVRGEPLRRVDWRATARHRQLIVREFAAPRRARVRITIVPGGWSRTRLDEAAALASGLAAGYRAGGHDAEIVANGNVTSWGLQARVALAGLAPHAGQDAPDPSVAAHRGDDVTEPGSGVDLRVVLTPGDDEAGVDMSVTAEPARRARGPHTRGDLP